jgi:hypothetical protein
MRVASAIDAVHRLAPSVSIDSQQGGGAMRWVLILMLVVALTACGGDDDTANGNVGTDDASPAPASATEAPADSDSADTDSAASGSTSISYTGAQSGEITDEGACGGGPSGDGLQLFTSLYDEDEGVTWMFQISIPAYDGPGQYDVGQSLLAGGTVSFDDTSITFSNNSGDGWGSTREQGGFVSVDAEGVSGTVDATLVAEDGSSEIHVSGAWACS